MKCLPESGPPLLWTQNCLSARRGIILHRRGHLFISRGEGKSMKALQTVSSVKINSIFGVHCRRRCSRWLFRTRRVLPPLRRWQSFSGDRILQSTFAFFPRMNLEGRGRDRRASNFTIKYLEDQYRSAGLEPGNPTEPICRAWPLVGMQLRCQDSKESSR